MNTLVQDYAFPPTAFLRKNQPSIYTNRMKTQIIIRDVVMLEGEGNYTYFHMKCGKKILVSRTLKEYCEIFGQYDFVRIRKSHLINLHYLKEIDDLGELSVIMQTGKRIEISRRKKIDFNLQFRAFKQKK